MKFLLATACAALAAGSAEAGKPERGSAVIRNTTLWEEMRAGLHLETPQPHTYLNVDELPETFTWAQVNGASVSLGVRLFPPLALARPFSRSLGGSFRGVATPIH